MNLIDHNCQMLGRIEKLVKSLSRDQYQSTAYSAGHSSIGQHVRHILDHYQCLLAVLQTDEPLIDYDNRQRVPQLEKDQRFVLTTLQQYQQQLRTIHAFGAVSIRQSTGVALAETLPSTLQRELAFLHSHATHHLAIIKSQLIELGLDVDEQLGVAPSTLAYQTRQKTA